MSALSLPQACTAQHQGNFPARQSPSHWERDITVNYQFPHPFRALREGPIWFSAQAEMYRDRNKEEKQGLPGSGSDCSSQWPALQMTQAAFLTEETNRHQGSPVDFSLHVSTSQIVWVPPQSLSHTFSFNLPTPARAQDVHRHPAPASVAVECKTPAYTPKDDQPPDAGKFGQWVTRAKAFPSAWGFWS